MAHKKPTLHTTKIQAQEKNVTDQILPSPRATQRRKGDTRDKDGSLLPHKRFDHTAGANTRRSAVVTVRD